MHKPDEFKPDWISAPGDTIADVLAERGLSLVEFADRMGETPERVKDLLRGHTLITIDTARRLEVVLGASAAFWMIRESQYREDITRLQSDLTSVGAEWLSELPLRDLIKFGWLKTIPHSTDKVAACLHFFGVPDIRTWRESYGGVLELAAFKTSQSFDSNPGAVAAWLRKGEIDGASIDCNPWDPKRFRELLSSIRSLTRKKDPTFFISELVKRCAECGVAVVIVRAPGGCRASGATRFLSPSKALLMLSFRYLSDDHFWFAFFHEAAHLLLHSKSTLFLEGVGMLSSKEEKEADEFAARVLIPPEFEKVFLTLGADARKVIKFSRHVGVSPGIVVGQLQHFGRLKPHQLNNLKRRFTWSDQ